MAFTHRNRKTKRNKPDAASSSGIELSTIAEETFSSNQTTRNASNNNTISNTNNNANDNNNSSTIYLTDVGESNGTTMEERIAQFTRHMQSRKRHSRAAHTMDEIPQSPVCPPTPDPTNESRLVETPATPNTKTRNAIHLLGDTNSGDDDTDYDESASMRTVAISGISSSSSSEYSPPPRITSNYTSVLRNQAGASLNEWRQRQKEKRKKKQQTAQDKTKKKKTGGVKRKNIEKCATPQDTTATATPPKKKRRLNTTKSSVNNNIINNSNSNSNSNSNTNEDSDININNDNNIPEVGPETINAENVRDFTYVSNWDKLHASMKVNLHRRWCLAPSWLHISTTKFEIPRNDKYYTKMMKDNNIDMSNSKSKGRNNSNRNKNQREHPNTVAYDGLYERNKGRYVGLCLMGAAVPVTQELLDHDYQNLGPALYACVSALGFPDRLRYKVRGAQRKWRCKRQLEDKIWREPVVQQVVQEWQKRFGIRCCDLFLGFGSRMFVLRDQSRLVSFLFFVLFLNRLG